MKAFVVPAWLALASALALGIGLVEDGALDVVASVLLAVPLVAIGRAWGRRERARS